MRTPLLLLLTAASCFRFEVAGGVLACEDDECPDGFVCEDGLRVVDEDFGFCATEEIGAPCISNIGCSPTPECIGECEVGVVCVDPASVEDLPAFQVVGEGICQQQIQLDDGDDCTPLNVLERCPTGLGCSENEQCETRFGEDGDTCDNAINIDEPGTFLFDLAGLGADSLTTLVDNPNIGDCGFDSLGSDLFIRYTVQEFSDVVITTNNNGTISDTIIYVGTGCDVNNAALLAGEFDCADDDGDSVFNSLASTLVLQNQGANTQIFIVVDSFAVGVDGLVELTITEE